MEQTKEEILANLYALRAGLSIASGISEKAQDASFRIGHINEIEIPNKQREMQSISGKIMQETKVYSDEVDRCYDAFKIHERKIAGLKEEERGLISALKKCRIRVIVASSFLVCLIVLVVLCLAGVDPIILIAAEPIAIGMIISFIILRNKNGGWESQRRRLKEIRTYDLGEEQGLLQKGKTEFERAIKRRTDGANRIQEKYDNLRKELQEQQKKLENERLDCEAIVMIEKERFSSVYTSLQNEFSSFLDERDWKNVDLIIFSYETGRALDLRDALLQVDNERRNQRLVKAVRDASKSISGTIARGFNEMSHSLSTLSTKFDSLDRNIASSMQSIGGKFSKMIEQNKAVEGKLQQISSISSAKEALQRKMYASSDEMASDIRYMRELSHRTYYGT